MEPIEFKKLTTEIRKNIIEYCYKTKSTHIGSNFSIIEILTYLYFDHLNVFPDKKLDPNRDRFVLSKGHACLSLYIILQRLGFISKETLDSFATNGGLLEHHTRRNLEMSVDVSGGSLGHGLGIGAGLALAAKKDGLASKVYVLLSDGEMDEGSIWEAVLFAGHQNLDNLVAIVDYNKMQALGKTQEVIDLDSLSDKFKSFGWEAMDIDGHDYEQIENAFKKLPYKNGKPNAIISNSIKGKGVSFMEMNLLWHYRAPNDEEYKLAMSELNRKI